MGAELFHADVQTENRTDKTPVVAFHNFANAPSNGDERHVPVSVDISVAFDADY